MFQNMFNLELILIGIWFGNWVIGYFVVICLLDNGCYDKYFVDGMEILVCIMEVVESNWIMFNIEKELIFWCWLLVVVFIIEELEKNGIVDVLNDIGGVDIVVIYFSKYGVISVYLGFECFVFVNYIELGVIEKYGLEVGQQLVLWMYQDMVIVDEEFGFRLLVFGWEGFNFFYDSFIEYIQIEGVFEVLIMY